MSETVDPRQAWVGFCERLKDAGSLLSRESTPRAAIDQVTGARALSRNIALALQF